ncbi:MAG TPA: hemerythrin domain-containing protein [Polyangia bacterium]|jgi:hemerythrin-like domain-containing protein|nr:hemerythrin domain-containing protein [Polyangia bacterium]
MGHRDDGRRAFLKQTTAASLALLAGGANPAGAAAPDKNGDVPPTEDLMREHGVLRRILLVYEEAARRLPSSDDTVLDVIAGAANVVHRFVEGYHEKLEEQFVFPTLEKAGKLIELTTVLRVQHGAGRKVTDAILQGTKGGKTGKAAGTDQRQALVNHMQSFVRMYAPHAAWEDTELFPIYRGLFNKAELDRLGDQFEGQEHKLLGGGGFEGSLRDVADLEKALGIHDLAQFTPR